MLSASVFGRLKGTENKSPEGRKKKTPSGIPEKKEEKPHRKKNIQSAYAVKKWLDGTEGATLRGAGKWSSV